MSKGNFKSNEPCVACGENFADRCYHHVLTRKARPDLVNEKRNMLSLCLTHHNMIHTKGLAFMAMNKYVYAWLKNNEWEYCEFRQKWVNDFIKEG